MIKSHVIRDKFIKYSKNLIPKEMGLLPDTILLENLLLLNYSINPIFLIIDKEFSIHIFKLHSSKSSWNYSKDSELFNKPENKLYSFNLTKPLHILIAGKRVLLV